MPFPSASGRKGCLSRSRHSEKYLMERAERSEILMRMRTSRQSGFSLVELISVLAILLSLSAIAANRYLKMRQVAQEAAAVSNMREIANAEATYVISHPEVGYVPLARLGPAEENLISADLAAGEKQGYNFSVLLKDGMDKYAILAIPQTAGSKSFILDNSGKLTSTICNKPATATQTSSGGRQAH